MESMVLKCFEQTCAALFGIFEMVLDLAYRHVQAMVQASPHRTSRTA